MPNDVQRYRKQLAKNPARGKVLREVEDALAQSGSHAVLADLLEERLRALEEAGARQDLIAEVRQRSFDALLAHAARGDESLAAARSALRAAVIAASRGSDEGRQESALWALVRGVSDDEVRSQAIEFAGGLETSRGLAKAALERAAFKDRKGALRHVLSRLAEQNGDVDSAFFEALRAARTPPPMQRYLDETFRLALMTGRFEEVSLVFTDAVASTDIDSTLRGYLRLKLAHLLERHLDRATDALRIFGEILAEDPDNAEARKRGERLAEKLGAELVIPEPPPPIVPPPPPVDSSPGVHGLSEKERAEVEELEPAGDQSGVFASYSPAAMIPAPIDDIMPAPLPEALAEDDVAAEVFAASEADTRTPDAAAFDVDDRLAAQAAQTDASTGAADTDPSGGTLPARAPAGRDPVDSAPAEAAHEVSADDVLEAADDDVQDVSDDDVLEHIEDGDADEVGDTDILETDALPDEDPARSFTAALVSTDPMRPEPTQQASTPVFEDEDEPGASSPEVTEITTPDLSETDRPRPTSRGLDHPSGQDSRSDEFRSEEVRTQEVRDAQIVEISEVRHLPFDVEELERRGDYATLADGLAEHLPARPTLEELLHIADLYETRLGVAHKAFPHYARALEFHDDTAALAGVLRCAPGAPDAAAALLDGLLEARGPRDEAVASLTRIVAAGEAERGAVAQAVERLEPIFAKHTGDPGLFRQLDRLYRELGQPARRADLRARANFGDALTRLGMLSDRVNLLEEAGDLSGALEAARSLQAAQPSSADVARRVLALAEKSGDVSALRDATLTLMGLADHDESLLLARGLAERAEADADVATARTAWREVLRRHPGDRDALRSLTELLEGDEALHGELIEVLNLRLTIARNTQDEAQQLMVLHRVAELHASHGRDDDEESALRQALEVDPDDDAALNIIEQRWRGRAAWRELAELYESLAGRRETAGAPLRMWLEAARLYRDQLGRRSNARGALQKALELDPDDGQALRELASLCLELGDPEAAVAHLERATRRQEGSELASTLCQLGRLYEEHLMQGEAAVQTLRRALDADPRHAEARDALQSLYRRGGEWEALVEVLVQRASLGGDAGEAAQALVEAAGLLVDNLDQAGRAEELLTTALQRAPQLDDARRRLIDLMVAREDFTGARGHLELMQKRPGSSELSLDHLVALARALAASGEVEPAEAHLRDVIRRAPSHLPALRALGDLLVEDGDADAEETIAVLEQRVLHHGPALSPVEAARVHGQIGILRRGKADLGGARKALRHALTLMPEDSPDPDVLAAHAELLADDDQLDEALAQTERLAALLQPIPAAARWAQAGQLAEKLQDLERAVHDYGLACELDPDRMDAFEAQLRIEVARGHAEGALRAAERLIEKEVNPARLSQLEVAVATICRSSLDDPQRAANYLRQAIEHDPENAQALAAAEELFEELGDARGLATVLENTLARIPRDQAHERLLLLDKLVQVRRYELRDLAGAVQALEELLALDDQNPKAREDLARLYAETGDDDKAVRTWREVLRRDPLAIEAYRAMVALFRRRKHYDAAYCVAATMVALEQADDEVRSIVKRLRPPFPSWPKVPANPARVLDALVHPLARGTVRELLALAAPAVWPQFARGLKDFGLKRRDLLAPSELPSSLALALRQGSRVLGVTEPPVYRGGHVSYGITLLPVDPPALLIGADVQRGGMTPERAFAFGRTMAYLRPENLLAAALSVQELRGICEAVLLRAMPKVEMDRATREFDRLGGLIEKRLGAAEVDRLVELGREYYTLRSGYAMQQLVSAIAYGTDRVGFLFAGELAPAVSALKAAAGTEHIHSARLAIKELVCFSVSADHLVLREELGLQVRDTDAERVLSLD